MIVKEIIKLFSDSFAVSLLKILKSKYLRSCKSFVLKMIYETHCDISICRRNIELDNVNKDMTARIMVFVKYRYHYVVQSNVQ